MRRMDSDTKENMDLLRVTKQQGPQPSNSEQLMSCEVRLGMEV